MQEALVESESEEVEVSPEGIADTATEVTDVKEEEESKRVPNAFGEALQLAGTTVLGKMDLSEVGG